MGAPKSRGSLESLVAPPRPPVLDIFDLWRHCLQPKVQEWLASFFPVFLELVLQHHDGPRIAGQGLWNGVSSASLTKLIVARFSCNSCLLPMSNGRWSCNSLRGISWRRRSAERNGGATLPPTASRPDQRINDVLFRLASILLERFVGYSSSQQQVWVKMRVIERCFWTASSRRLKTREPGEGLWKAPTAPVPDPAPKNEEDLWLLR